MTRLWWRPVPVLTGMACLILAGGCSDGATTTPAEHDAWPSTTSPVSADGLIWATGSEVHLPGGSTIDTGRPAGAYVVGGPGVWFASAEVGELEVDELPPLRLATPDGVEETGAHPAVGSLTATPDGHWLAFLDRLDGGGGAAEAVVVDLTTGDEVVRSQEGLVPDDQAGVDWRDLYEDAPVQLLGIVDETAYVGGLSSVVAHDLSTGDTRTIEPQDVSDAPWYEELHPDPPLWNGDRSWLIPAQEFDADPVLESADGRRLTTSVEHPLGPLGSPAVTGPRLESWALRGWLDDGTVVALTPSRDGFDDSWNLPALLSCAVPRGECTVIDGTDDGANLPVDRPSGLPRERAIHPG